MGLFSLGATKGSSKSTSSAYSQDRSNAFGRSSQNIAFEDLFAKLYGDSFGASGRVAESLPAFQGQADQLFSGGTSFLDELMGEDAGSTYMRDRLGGEGVLNDQISSLQTDLGKLFRDELMPSITGDSINSGTLGGGRQGVAQGLAVDRIAQQFQQGSTSLRAADQLARDGLAQEYSSGRRESAGIGLGALPGVLGLAEAGVSSEFLPQSMLAQVLGGPTTLTDSLSESSSYGFSNAKSRSKSSSSGFSFDI